MNKDRAELLTGREVRRFPVELRGGTSDGVLTLDGYASVTETPYEMGGYTEVVRRGAFSNTLSQNPDVQLLINHEGLPLARTGLNMTLSEDRRGLHVVAELDASDPDVQRLAPKVERGLIDQMSFAFRVVRQEWDDSYDNRSISEVNIHRGDVSVVNQGASPTTSFSMREFTDALVEVRAGKTLSTATLNVLTQVLGLVSSSEENLDTADTMLAALIGVPDPEAGEANSAPAPESNLSYYAARAYLLTKKSA